MNTLLADLREARRAWLRAWEQGLPTEPHTRRINHLKHVLRMIDAMGGAA